MPYALEPVSTPAGPRFFVRDVHGKRYSHAPLPRARAVRQLRALWASAHGGGAPLSGGARRGRAQGNRLHLAPHHHTDTDAQLRADAARYHVFMRHHEEQAAAAERAIRDAGGSPPPMTGDDVTDHYESAHLLATLEREHPEESPEDAPLRRLLRRRMNATYERTYLDDMADELETRMLRRVRPFETRNPDGTPVAARADPPGVTARPIPMDVVRAHVLPFLDDAAATSGPPPPRIPPLPAGRWHPNTPGHVRGQPWPPRGSGAPAPPPPSRLSGGMDMGPDHLAALEDALTAALNAMGAAVGARAAAVNAGAALDVLAGHDAAVAAADRRARIAAQRVEALKRQIRDALPRKGGGRGLVGGMDAEMHVNPHGPRARAYRAALAEHAAYVARVSALEAREARITPGAPGTVQMRDVYERHEPNHGIVPITRADADRELARANALYDDVTAAINAVRDPTTRHGFRLGYEAAVDRMIDAQDRVGTLANTLDAIRLERADRARAGAPLHEETRAIRAAASRVPPPAVPPPPGAPPRPTHLPLEVERHIREYVGRGGSETKTGGARLDLENMGLHGLFTALHAALGALRDARDEVAEIKDRAARAAPPVRAELEADLDDLRKIIRKIQRRIDALRAAIADREATVPTHADVADPRLSSRPRGPLRER